jgi:hypothetical protein
VHEAEAGKGAVLVNAHLRKHDRLLHRS